MRLNKKLKEVQKKIYELRRFPEPRKYRGSEYLSLIRKNQTRGRTSFAKMDLRVFSIPRNRRGSSGNKSSTNPTST